ncbi:MAG: hypothetical protein CMF25_02990 [Kangiellaceae bacterium]|nr:hypothetical protein [Kangiellaceae bacterium]
MSLTALAYLAVFFYGLIKAMMGRPLYGVFSYILCLYMYAPGSWWGNSLPDLRWSLLSAIVTMLSIWMAKSKENANLTPLERTQAKKDNWFSPIEIKLFLAFVIWVWIQNGWAISGGRHQEFSVMVTKFFILIYMIKNAVKSEKDLYMVIVAHIIGCAYFGYLGLTQHSGGRFESAPTPGMSDGNLLSIHMIPMLIAASYILLSNVGNKKYFLIPFIVLTLNAIFLTQSRGALLGMAAVGVVSLFWVPKPSRKLYRRFAILAVLAVSSLMGPQVVERLSALQADDDGKIQEKSAESRLVILKAQVEMAKLDPLTGQGHRGTLFLSPIFIPIEYMTQSGGKKVRASHNLTMSYFVDHGIIGATLYFSILIVVFLRGFKIRKWLLTTDSNLSPLYIGCTLSLFAIFVTSQFSNSMRLEVDVWFIAMLSLLYQWIEKARREKAALPAANSTKERLI